VRAVPPLAVRTEFAAAGPGREPLRLLRYWHTLRHLRPIQIYGRAWSRLHKPRPDLRPAPPLRVARGDWQAPAQRRASMQDADTLRFLNETRRVVTPADWNSAEHDKLWLYNLHYFDDLNADGAEARREWHRALIARWIAENPPGHGNGWEPYPLSLRIVNWLKWALAGNALAPEWVESLAVQVRFLSARLEWHLLGNHLFANAKALVVAGLYFEGPEADAWQATGLAILAREVSEQVLADGGHFELSPMYHAVILEDLLDLINLSVAYPGLIPDTLLGDWRRAAQRMRRWLAAMLHPDGAISFFNDAAFGIAPDPNDLQDYAERLGLGPCVIPKAGVTHLAQSGYIRVQRREAVALLDVAQIGPDYLPGHAHADTLSFELSLFGRRLIVNSGTSVYGTGRDRLRQRSTAAHSTVEVDGENSSEVWGGFRVARRARPFDLEIAGLEGAPIVHCAHDGYRRLSGRVVHRRQWHFEEHSLAVSDLLEGVFRHAIARFHLHPGVTATGDGIKGALLLEGGQTVRWRLTGGHGSITPSTWHPEFGVSIPTHCLEVRLARRDCTLTLEW